MRLPIHHHAANAVQSKLAALALSAALVASPMTAPPAMAEMGRPVGEIAGSGLVFKDILKITAFDDPKVSGVQLYLSDFQRPVTEKLGKGDLFSDPSQGGLTCSHNGKVVVSADTNYKPDGEEVFSESRSLLFKSLKVKRVVDEPGQSVVYAVFSQRLDKNDDSNNSRFKSNLCAVHVDQFQKAAAN
tara:strand:+ start:370 stop:930 length:561 start_codon:yes stop_codon:yes gene_type:complete